MKRPPILASARRRIIEVLGGYPIKDNFNSTFSTLNWAGTNVGSPSNVSGRLRLNTTSSFPQAQTSKVFGLIGYRILIQIPTVPAYGNGSKITQFIIGDGTNSAYFSIPGNPSSMVMGGNGITGTTSIAYDSVAHQWLGFRLNAGTLFYEASPDGINWTTLRSLAAPSWIINNQLSVTLLSGYSGSESASYAEFDNFNIPG